MHICEYTLVRIFIIENMHYCVPDSSGSGLDRICILVHCGQQILSVTMSVAGEYQKILTEDKGLGAGIHRGLWPW